MNIRNQILASNNLNVNFKIFNSELKNIDSFVCPDIDGGSLKFTDFIHLNIKIKN